MNSVNKILRDSKILIDGAKDTVLSNLVEARRTNIIDATDEQLQKIFEVISVSIDESFQKSINVFHNMVKRHIETSES